MGSEISIHQMTMADKPAVLDFLKKAYPDNPRHCDPVYWDWHFTDAPHIQKDKLPIWLAKSGDRIAGQLATLPVELNIRGEKTQALWVLDWIVDEDFRRRGIGKKLALAAEAFSPYLLGVNTDQQHAPALLLGLNWVVVSKIPRYHKVLFPGEAVRELSKIGVLRAFSNAVFFPLRRSYSGNKEAKTEIRLLKNFDTSFDDFWHLARSQWNCSTSRDSAMLDWQYRRQPYKHFEVLGSFRDGKLAGYAVLFPRKKTAQGAIEKAAISDICYLSDRAQETIDSLLQASLALCIERKIGGLVTDAIDPLLAGRLRHFGFWKINSPLQLMARAPENQEIVYNVDQWFLTRGDSDISIFEHSNL